MSSIPPAPRGGGTAGDSAAGPLAPPAPPPAPTVAPAARAEAAVKVYGRGDTAVRALDGIHVEFAAQRFSAIMGASGSGKSTLLHCLAGLDRLTSGETYIGAVALSRLSDYQLTLLRREKVGFIFQSLNLVPTLSALDNITLPLSIAGRRADPGLLDAVIRITGLHDRLRHRPSELSGGQQQRVAAARALVSRPEIIFADEPTGNLDSRSGLEVLQLFHTLHESGGTIVIVTHDEDVAQHCQRILGLHDGRLVRDAEVSKAAVPASGGEDAPC